MDMALQLIQAMTSPWKPEMFHDEYREALEKMIEEKVEHGGQAPSAPKRPRASSKANAPSPISQRRTAAVSVRA